MLVILFALVWVAIGLAAYWWMARRGHRSRWWLLLAALLGPIFAATVKDRAEREPRAVEHWRAGERYGGWPRILVGIDGSEESEQALHGVLDLLPDGVGTLMLATVVDYDAPGEADTDDQLSRAHDRLAQLQEVASGRSTRAVDCEVLTGPPAEALLRCAADQEVDLVVVGRRGRGMSTRLLGSVATQLLRTPSLPVLLAAPAPHESHAVRDADTRRQDH
jgi:nucleotide-binding universal stress UspA family protein